MLRSYAWMTDNGWQVGGSGVFEDCKRSRSYVSLTEACALVGKFIGRASCFDCTRQGFRRKEE